MNHRGAYTGKGDYDRAIFEDDKMIRFICNLLRPAATGAKPTKPSMIPNP
jgi:hypothetical protein